MARKKPAMKTDPERVRRPTLPRTEPIRSWSTLFGASKTNGSSGANGSHASNGARSRADAVQRGVELGYRVIDDYIRQGATVASAFSNPGQGRAPSGDDLPKMTERMMQYASDFSSLWFEAMSIMLGSMNGRAPATNGHAANHSAPQPSTGVAAAPTQYVLEIRSELAAEVTVSLDGAAAKLSVEPLRARGKKRAITDVTIEQPGAGAPLKVRVRVPAGLPAGRYDGAVLDAESRKPRGRLTVVLKAG